MTEELTMKTLVSMAKRLSKNTEYYALYCIFILYRSLLSVHSVQKSQCCVLM